MLRNMLDSIDGLKWYVRAGLVLLGILLIAYISYSVISTFKENKSLAVQNTENKALVSQLKGSLDLRTKSENANTKIAVQSASKVKQAEAVFANNEAAMEEQVALIQNHNLKKLQHASDASITQHTQIPKAGAASETTALSVAGNSAGIKLSTVSQEDIDVSRARIMMVWKNYCYSYPKDADCQAIKE